MSGARLLLVILLGMLAACETPLPGPEAPAAPPPTAPSLAELWQQSASSPDLDSLLSRFRGRGLRQAVRRAATTTDPLPAVAQRLQSAQARSRQVRAILAELYGYRKAGGVLLDSEEKSLWQRLVRADGEEGADELLLVRARHSLALQAGRAWFHLQGVERLHQQAVAVRELRRQIVERRQTSSRLERGGRDGVLAARKDLARVDARVRQLERALAAARKALSLLGVKYSPSGDDAVQPVPAGVPLKSLARRSDLRLALVPLEEAGLEPAWPDVKLTARGAWNTRRLSALLRLDEAALAQELGLDAGKPPVKELVHVLRQALREVKSALYQVRQLNDQARKLKGETQQARRKVNRLRARYSARRATLLEILEAQVALTEVTGRAAYVERRLQDQRLVAHFVLGMP